MLAKLATFVLKNFTRMYGGEIFVPKIPSIKITDLATSIAPQLRQEIVGIRPGEKLHEIMCPSDDSHLTIEFSDHYVIRPSISFVDRNVDYKNNAIGEKGVSVSNGFEYNSGRNKVFLNIDEIKEYDKYSAI